MSTIEEMTKRKHKVAIMNAVHDLPVLVARDLGFFKDEGLDIEFVTTPGMAQVTTSHTVKFDSVFDRPLDSAYNEGGIDQYRMCEWGIMKRAVEANCEGRRGRKIVALGASMSQFAIVTSRDSNIYAPEMLKNKDIAVTPNNGSHFTTLKMMEGFLAQEHVKTTNAGTMVKRLEAQLSPQALFALQTLRSLTDAASLDLYLVGGAVRDLLLERPNLDLDLAIEADVAPIAEALAAATRGRVVLHPRFGTSTISGRFRCPRSASRVAGRGGAGGAPPERPEGPRRGRRPRPSR